MHLQSPFSRLRFLFIFIEIDSGLRMLLLLSCVIIAGMAADGPPKTHYRVKNSSICLQVGKSATLNVEWSYYDKLIVFQNIITPNYTDKVDYNPSNHTLCLKKLTEKDSGEYKALIVDSKYEKSTETNHLIVQESVPKPVIRMSVMGSNLSVGFCNISINCSVLDEWLWAVCHEDRCRPFKRSFSEVNITILAHNRSVVCSGHNQVSNSKVSKSIDATCYSKRTNKHEEKSSPSGQIVIVIAVAVGVILCAFIGFLIKRLCWTEYNGHQTSTAQLIQSQPIEAQSPPVSSESPSSSTQPDVSYENVEAAEPSQINHPTSHPKEELGSKESQAVDTVYSVLQLPRVTDSLGNSDRENTTKVDDTIQESSTSSVTLGQIDTVYSTLQKPKT
ncbi:uncharacterized protein LOC132958359 [Labrus mixtus]|uniref:uncharacterized protein LOC132958359 n=1 Tax=Labrus mixtus TaxID=508554 RepID=UPI0029C0867A|nr:uncharacterized protein LOC132958359 [Labrus mixtus]